MKDSDIIRVAFYTRVSTPEQWSKGFWLDFQINDLNDLIQYRKSQTPQWITNKKWHYEDDGFSGWDLKRPGYKQMMEDAKAWKFDMIAVWKIDRMSRNLSHLLKSFEDLKSYGVGFYSVKENIDFSWPIWKLTFHIFGALAEFEREVIKTRTTEWKIASAKSWNFVKASAPYWYIKEKNESGKGSKLKIIQKEAKIVRKIFERFVYDDWNYSQIADELNKLKIKKWEGAMRKNITYTAWYDTTVKNVITETVYMWETHYTTKKEWEEYDILISTPQIISRQLFELAQSKAKEVEEKWQGGKKKFLLSGKIYDAMEFTERGTMRKFIGVARTKWGHSYRRDGFIDKNKKKVANKEFPWKPLDDFVWDIILEFINKPVEFYKIYKKQTTILRSADKLREEKQILLTRIEEELVKQENIDRKEIDWRLSEEKADKYMQESIEAIKNNQKRIDEIDEKIENILNMELSKSVLEKISKEFIWRITGLNDEQKRRIADILVDRVLVSEDEDGNTVVDVVFRFNGKWQNWWGTPLEPKDESDNNKSPDDGTQFCDNGATDRDRTCDLTLRRGALFQLSYGCVNIKLGMFRVLAYNSWYTR